MISINFGDMSTTTIKKLSGEELFKNVISHA
jgi:hypothetical protein